MTTTHIFRYLPLIASVVADHSMCICNSSPCGGTCTLAPFTEHDELFACATRSQLISSSSRTQKSLSQSSPGTQLPLKLVSRATGSNGHPLAQQASPPSYVPPRYVTPSAIVSHPSIPASCPIAKQLSRPLISPMRPSPSHYSHSHNPPQSIIPRFPSMPFSYTIPTLSPKPFCFPWYTWLFLFFSLCLSPVILIVFAYVLAFFSLFLRVIFHL
jgi:CRISPR-associated DxTHG motif protein